MSDTWDLKAESPLERYNRLVKEGTLKTPTFTPRQQGPSSYVSTTATPIIPKTYPLILRLVRRYIAKLNFVCSTRYAEGRRNSQEDEDNIIQELVKFFNRKGKLRIIPSRNRWWYDFLVVDNRTGSTYPVNFKSTSMQSRPDNTGQKVGMLYSLTTVEFAKVGDSLTFPQCNSKGEIGWDTFDDLLIGNRGDSQREYYYLVLNKEITSIVLLVGLRDMVVSNQTRNSAHCLPFQTNWRHNFTPVVRSYEDAWKHVVGQYKKNVECLVSIHNGILHYTEEA